MNNLQNNNSYYKYRKLIEFERLLDIIVKKRLYGAPYKELNDPMEGKFNKTGLEDNEIKGIYYNLSSTRVCSFAEKQEEQDFPNNFLMWSHYADGHKGCCIEFQTTKKNNSGWELKKVEYKNELEPLEKKTNPNEYIKQILSIKTKIWNEEHEFRAIKIYDKDKFNSLSPYYHIKIKAVYFGDRVNTEKAKFYKNIIQSIDEKIEVFSIKLSNTRTIYFPELICKKID